MKSWLALALLSLGSASAQPPDPAAGQRRSVDGMSEAAERSRTIAEARRFMEDHARALRAGDRAALAAHYSRYGALRFAADSAFYTRQDWERIRDAFAAPSWRPPARFDWFTMEFIPIGPDAVAVAATVDRSGEADRPVTHLYSALLVREQGEFRIRMEHEAPAPPR